jgi:hypothetical protein
MSSFLQEFYEPKWVDTDEIGNFGEKVSKTVGEVRKVLVHKKLDISKMMFFLIHCENFSWPP